MNKKIALLLGAAMLFAGLSQAAEKPLIRIGARVFTEQTVLAEITAQYLRANGYTVRVTEGLGSNIARQAQETGQLDLMWEYTGVSLVSYNHIDERMPSAEATYARVKALDAEKGLVWLTPSKFSNTYALGLPQAVAKAYPQLNTISQLQRVLRDEHERNHLRHWTPSSPIARTAWWGCASCMTCRSTGATFGRWTAAWSIPRCAITKSSPAWCTPPTGA